MFGSCEYEVKREKVFTFEKKIIERFTRKTV